MNWNSFIGGVLVWLIIGVIYTHVWLLIGLINDRKDEGKPVSVLISEIYLEEYLIYLVATTICWPIAMGFAVRGYYERRKAYTGPLRDNQEQ